MRTIKVLHVVGALGRGGDTTAIMHILEFVQKSKWNVEFEFLTHKGYDSEFVMKLISKNIKVNILKGDVRKLGPIKYFKVVLEYLKENKYDVVHFHTSFQSSVGLTAAKIAGVPIRICHSHTSAVQRKFNKYLLRIFLPICKLLIELVSTKKVACSKEAADNLFINNKDTHIVYNGLQINNFKNTDENKIKIIKEQLKIRDTNIVIGQVGRFSNMKNQEFTINIAERIKDEKFKFILLGTGENFNRLKLLVEEKNLKNVYLLGQVKDVNNYMSLFDYLLLPSLYGEGLPVVLIEQQILKDSCICLVNDNVSKEANIGNVIYKGLVEEEWIKEIKKNRSFNNVKYEHFDINVTAEKWLELYNTKGG